MPNPRRFASFAVVCLLSAAALPAWPQQAPDQGVSEPTEVTSLAGLPAPVREQLAAGPGDMSDRGGPFNPGCVMTAGVPSRRFVRALVGKGVARVDVEQGGIAHYVETLEFREAGGSWKLVGRENGSLPPR
jgi:hypothetical protein